MRQLVVSSGITALALAAGFLAATASAAPVWTPVSTLESTNGNVTYSYTPTTVSDSTGRSTVLVVDNHGLEAFVRSPRSPVFAAPTLLTADPDVGGNVDAAGFSATSLVDGTVVVAWPAQNFTEIESAVLVPGSSSWPTVRVATGSNLGFVDAAAGADGGAALAWTDGSAVQVASLQSAQSFWQGPSTVSDPVAGSAYPLVEDPRVVVGNDGSVTATWNAYDGNDATGNYIYRARGATGPTNGAPWLTPQWISSGTAGQPVLTAGTDGSITEVWADGSGGLDAASVLRR